MPFTRPPVYQVQNKISKAVYARGFSSTEKGDRFIREHLGDAHLSVYESVEQTVVSEETRNRS